jgi:glycerol-3-phosphate dehydrogenase
MGTAALSRSHVILKSESGLLSIAGGKWTTYRIMAEEVVDEAIISTPGLVAPGKCVTETLKVIGSHNWSPNLYIQAVQSYGLDVEVAQHLSTNYGDRLHKVVKLCRATGKKWPVLGVPLSSGFPFTEAEVRYVVRHEYARTLVDVLARRLRVSFLDAAAALDIAQKVVIIMQQELKWTPKRKELEMFKFRKFLQTMGSNEAISRSEFNALEIVSLRTFWDSVDIHKSNSVTFGQLLTKLESLKIFHDPQILAKAFGEVVQNEKEGKEMEASIDFAGFLDLLFLARQQTRKVNREDLLSQSLVSAGSKQVIIGGGA